MNIGSKYSRNFGDNRLGISLTNFPRKDKLNTPRRRTLSGGGSPISASSLSLWLKADAGVTSTPQVYISQIVFDSAGTPSANGTYTRASGGTTSFVNSNGNGSMIVFDSAGGYFNWILTGEKEGNYDDLYSIAIIMQDNEEFYDDIDVLDGDGPMPDASVSYTTSPNTLVVTNWADQSGNSRNATPQTIYPTIIASSINSKPAISFNGDGSWLQIPQSNIGDNGNISIFVVLNYLSGLVLFNKGDLATFIATAWEITTSNGFGFVDNVESEDAFWNTVLGVDAIATGTPLLLEAFSSEGASQLAFNGTNSGEPSDGNEFGANNISQYLGIGAGGSTGGTQGNPLNARIAEIIIYNRQVTTPERQQVEAYLNAKYQIY